MGSPQLQARVRIRQVGGLVACNKKLGGLPICPDVIFLLFLPRALMLCCAVLCWRVQTRLPVCGLWASECFGQQRSSMMLDTTYWSGWTIRKDDGVAQVGRFGRAMDRSRRCMWGFFRPRGRRDEGLDGNHEMGSPGRFFFFFPGSRRRPAGSFLVFSCRFGAAPLLTERPLVCGL